MPDIARAPVRLDQVFTCQWPPQAAGHRLTLLDPRNPILGRRGALTCIGCHVLALGDVVLDADDHLPVLGCGSRVHVAYVLPEPGIELGVFELQRLLFGSRRHGDDPVVHGSGLQLLFRPFGKKRYPELEKGWRVFNCHSRLRIEYRWAKIFE